jgi:hypothetical protein
MVSFYELYSTTIVAPAFLDLGTRDRSLCSLPGAVTGWRALGSQRECHLRIGLYHFGAERRERHAEQTNSFAHRKLSRQQLVAD